MHLTQVHMENFKSFGRKLTVPFEPGFTGITGPNGSGKSNIGDAILFVLGPNSPRAIRAGRLTDLIFNGGAQGKGAPYCLVSLTFDNRSRTMPVDADDVTLTRKVKRAPKRGEPDAYHSYFYVNGRASQKKEFVDLLQHARISADGYNITQQGDVQAICNMTPAKRREIIDNISGVTRFDQDIQAADKQKGEVLENLERIGIVLEEIERSLHQLEKETGAAERHRELTQKVARTKGLMAWRRKEDLGSEIAEVQSQIAKYGDERAGLEQKLEALRAKFKDAQARFAEIEQQIREEGGEEVENIQREVGEARDRMVRLEEKMHFVRDELHGGEEDLLPVREELARIETELRNTRKVEAEATKTHADASKALDKARKDLDRLRDQVSQSDQGAMAINRELGLLKKEHEDKRIELHDVRLRFDRLNEKTDAVRRQVADLEADLEGVRTDRREAEGELEEARKATDGAGKQQKEMARRLFELRKAQAELTTESEDLEQRIRRLTRELAELQAAEAAAARAAGSAPHAVEEILKSRDDGSIKGIIGTIAELADADEAHQTALETAAGANLHAVVVQDDAVAAACIEMLKRTRAGRAKLLPLNKMVPGRPRGQALMRAKKDGCLGFALDLTRFDKRYHNAFWNVFGDTLVADSMDSGRRLMGGVRLVTLQGELFEAGGAMIGGSQGKKKGPAFTGSDRGRMDTLLRDIAQSEAAQEQVLARLATLRDETATLEQTLADAPRGPDPTKRREELERLLARLAEKLAALEEQVTERRARLAEKEDAAAELKASIESLEARLAELETLREERSQALLKGSKKEWRERMEALDAEVRDLTTQALEAEKRKDVAAKQAEIVEGRAKELQARIEGFGSGRGKLEADLKDLQKKYEMAKAEVDALMKMERKATEKLGGLRDKKDKVYEEITDLKVRMEKISDRMETHYSLILNAKAKLPGLEEAQAQALLELQEHQVTVGEDEEVPPFDELRQTLRNAERSIEQMGPVNQRALEEYEAQSARKADLDAEVARLHAQREELERLVTEIAQKKKDAFMEVFTAVSENFAEVYMQVSLGGKAVMELEDPDDPFAGGLILKAQPLGKRVTRLDALSGGEKSLTSMAFIFAIQRYDPSPFYYFDEVDQNLDAVNSELLARLVRSNSEFAQFIVVSLRKITLKEAHHLYGVTQQEPGQSEVIANFRLEEMREDDEDGGEDGAGRDETLSDALQGLIQVEIRE